MKTLRKLLATLILTSALTFSAVAGDMGTGIIQPPPPPPPPGITGDMGTGNSATAETNATGDMGTGVASTGDPVTETVLSLLHSLFALI